MSGDDHDGAALITNEPEEIELVLAFRKLTLLERERMLEFLRIGLAAKTEYTE